MAISVHWGIENVAVFFLFSCNFQSRVYRSVWSEGHEHNLVNSNPIFTSNVNYGASILSSKLSGDALHTEDNFRWSLVLHMVISWADKYILGCVSGVL